MGNAWLSIPAKEYDEHQSHPSVQQRAFLDRVFADVLANYNPRSIALLGCATGGGLQFVDAATAARVTAIDINPAFVAITRSHYSARLPQLEVVEADLESYRLEHDAYDLVHCALLLEYVDPDPLLRMIARSLTRRGTLVVVLQLPSRQVNAITETGCESLKLLAPLMRLHEPGVVRQHAATTHLRETKSAIEQLTTGKEFYIGHFHRSEDGE